MEHVVTYTDIPTILSIKINENIGYINNVYFRINGVNIGRVNWTSRFQTKDNSWYSVLLQNISSILLVKISNLILSMKLMALFTLPNRLYSMLKIFMLHSKNKIEDLIVLYFISISPSLFNPIFTSLSFEIFPSNIASAILSSNKFCIVLFSGLAP